MKNKILIALCLALLVGCEPDATDDPTADVTIDFVGTWNRDSVLVYEIESNGSRTPISEESNVGRYKFNADKTGVLSVTAGDYAINWSYNSTAKTMLISEVDWVGQVYSIQANSETVVRLVGKRNIGGGLQEERILKLSKR